ncbi:MAG: hypothetical protein JRJ84_14945 [Deltaproteobacteria bacterium]|nr:hypothetical protein [Deltaproteobacteria bacterium]
MTAPAQPHVCPWWMGYVLLNPAAFLHEVHGLLRPGGRLLIVEPRGHVKPAAFAATLEQAHEVGFSVVETDGLRAVLESNHGSG